MASSSEKKSVFDDLELRGVIKETTNDDVVRGLIDRGEAIVYWGTDPTGISCHIGHLLGLVTLCRLQEAGNKIIILLGGATALIGDPSGRSKERVLLAENEIKVNQAALLNTIAQVINFEDVIVVNNADWFSNLSIPMFLRDVGKCFSVSAMLRTDSVKSRLASESGVSFTEFAYSLLQAYDFYYLYTQHGCNIQIGGGDQFGNIIAGIDYTRRRCGARVNGLTTPLVVTNSGEKMGKSANGGAIWLDENLTKPYDFYQYWLNISDTDVEKFLLLYTFVSVEKIREIVKTDIIEAKKLLAFEVTSLVHTPEIAEQSKTTSQILFSGKNLQISSIDIPELSVDVNQLKNGLEIAQTLFDSGLVSSKSAARRLIAQGGAYVNNQPVSSEKLSESDLIDGQIILRAGKKKHALIKVTNVNEGGVYYV